MIGIPQEESKATHKKQEEAKIFTKNVWRSEETQSKVPKNMWKQEEVKSQIQSKKNMWNSDNDSTKTLFQIQE